ncbi:TIGR04086 family membrane protein [Cerasibacillus terrae]|uniref:TIGR04086 family membrane protein n=1 Tax=Cerasibacillus terrae TaxID=2498845 RepID=A0A5C8P361_9BACI|nr:TIGR04086 family membrane protein [Cerasibacillus terrae]TXL68075.1 TIGR04086 family membrane protein [Cerasibacillus terrae]
MRQQLSGLLYGWIIILSIILISSTILALLLRFTTFNEPTLSWVTLVIGLFAFFFGGLVAGVKGKAKGWIIGGLTGIGFTIFIFLIQYLGNKSGFSMEQLLSHLGYIFAAIFGGVIGVNMVVGQQE